MGDLEDIRSELREFARDRDWFQYHDPKNLAMAVASEAGELLAELRWLSTEDSQVGKISTERREAIRLEMADILIFLVRMADVLELDLIDAVRDKIAINEGRFELSDESPQL